MKSKEINYFFGNLEIHIFINKYGMLTQWVKIFFEESYFSNISTSRDKTSSRQKFV